MQQRQFREPLPPNRHQYPTQTYRITPNQPNPHLNYASSSYSAASTQHLHNLNHHQQQDLKHDHIEQKRNSSTDLLSRQGARILLQNLDPYSTIQPKVEQSISILMQDFLQRILKFSYHLAQHRNSKIVSKEDVVIAAEKLFDVDQDQMREDTNKIMNQFQNQNLVAAQQQQQQLRHSNSLR